MKEPKFLIELLTEILLFIFIYPLVSARTSGRCGFQTFPTSFESPAFWQPKPANCTLFERHPTCAIARPHMCHQERLSTGKQQFLLSKKSHTVIYKSSKTKVIIRPPQQCPAQPQKIE